MTPRAFSLPGPLAAHSSRGACLPASSSSFSRLPVSSLPLRSHTGRGLCVERMGGQFCLELLLLLRCKDPREVRRCGACVSGSVPRTSCFGRGRCESLHGARDPRAAEGAGGHGQARGREAAALEGFAQPVPALGCLFQLQSSDGSNDTYDVSACCFRRRLRAFEPGRLERSGALPRHSCFHCQLRAHLSKDPSFLLHLSFWLFSQDFGIDALRLCIRTYAVVA